MKLKYPENVSR